MYYMYYIYIYYSLLYLAAVFRQSLAVQNYIKWKKRDEKIEFQNRNKLLVPDSESVYSNLSYQSL